MGCLNVSIDSGKSVAHCEFTSHFFRTSRSATHRNLQSRLQYAELRIRVLESVCG